MKFRLLFLICMLLSTILLSQKDTLEFTIVVEPLVKNNKYLSVVSATLPDGSPILVKVWMWVNVPQDAVYIRPKNFKQF